MTSMALRNQKPMNRHELISRMVPGMTKGEVIVGGIGNTNFDLWAAGPRPENFYMLGSMGLAFSIGLGVALAQPDRPVIAMDGDGSLLMQLGCLSTIASVAPKNLTLILFDNGMYQITGGQKTVTASVADLVEIARASGLKNSAWATDEDDFDTLLKAAMKGAGPSLIGVPTDAAKAVGTTDRDPAKIRANFMEAIAS